MEDVDLILLLKYPSITKHKNGNNVIYKGTITVGIEDYAITITQTQNKKFLYDIPSQLQKFTFEIKDDLEKKSITSVINIIDVFKNYMTKDAEEKKPINRCLLYEKVLVEYHDFTRFYLNLKTCSLAEDLSRIKVSILDERNREHFFVVAINVDKIEKDEDAIFEIFEYDLPCERDNFKPASNLKEIYEQFNGIVDRLQPFFDLMEIFDKYCWVLDPVTALKQYNYRRIYLDENLSMTITVDPLNVMQMPKIIFLGPEDVVIPYRNRLLSSNLEEWDYNKDDLIGKILEVLNLDRFPQKPVAVEDANVNTILINIGECSICFAERLNNKITDIVCPNKSCGTYYHSQCLYEWLISVNTRKAYGDIRGNCPNCEKTICCPAPTG